MLSTTYLLPYRSSALSFGAGALSRLFDDLSGDTQYDQQEGVWRTELNLAGYKREDISVEATQESVTVTADSKRWGKRARTFWTGEIDPARVTATLEDGVLALECARPEHALPKRIEVKGG